MEDVYRKSSKAPDSLSGELKKLQTRLAASETRLAAAYRRIEHLESERVSPYTPTIGPYYGGMALQEHEANAFSYTPPQSFPRHPSQPRSISTFASYGHEDRYESSSRPPYTGKDSKETQ